MYETSKKNGPRITLSPEMSDAGIDFQSLSTKNDCEGGKDGFRRKFKGNKNHNFPPDFFSPVAV